MIDRRLNAMILGHYFHKESQKDRLRIKIKLDASCLTSVRRAATTVVETLGLQE